MPTFDRQKIPAFIARVLSCVLISAFVFQDAAWSIPDISPKRSPQADTLAPYLFSRTGDSGPRFFLKTVEALIDRLALPRDSITLDTVREALLTHSAEPWFAANIAVTGSEHEILISTASGHALRYFDPTRLSPAEPEKYKERVHSEPGQGPSEEINPRLHKQALVVKRGGPVIKKAMRGNPAVAPAAAGAGREIPAGMTLGSGEFTDEDFRRGDTTNPLIRVHIDEGRAFEVDESAETVTRIWRGPARPRDLPPEPDFRSAGIFSKIRAARDRGTMKSFVGKPGFDNLYPHEKEELIDIAVGLPISVILGHAVIGGRKNARGKTVDVYAHARTGKSRDKQGLKPAVWVGARLLELVSEEELAHMLLEEAQHVLKKPALLPSGRWINQDGKIDRDLSPLSGKNRQVIEHDLPLKRRLETLAGTVTDNEALTGTRIHAGVDPVSPAGQPKAIDRRLSGLPADMSYEPQSAAGEPAIPVAGTGAPSALYARIRAELAGNRKIPAHVARKLTDGQIGAVIEQIGRAGDSLSNTQRAKKAGDILARLSIAKDAASLVTKVIVDCWKTDAASGKDFDAEQWYFKCFKPSIEELQRRLTNKGLSADVMRDWIARMVTPFNNGITPESLIGKRDELSLYEITQICRRATKGIINRIGIVIDHSTDGSGCAAGVILGRESVVSPAGRNMTIFRVRTIDGSFGLGVANIDYVIIPEEPKMQFAKTFADLMALGKNHRANIASASSLRSCRQYSLWALKNVAITYGVERGVEILRKSDLAEELSHTDVSAFVEELWGRPVIYTDPAEELKRAETFVRKGGYLDERVLREAKGALPNRQYLAGRALTEVEGKIGAMIHSPYPAYNFAEFMAAVEAEASPEYARERPEYKAAYMFAQELFSIELIGRLSYRDSDWAEYLRQNSGGMDAFNERLRTAAKAIYAREFLSLEERRKLIEERRASASRAAPADAAVTGDEGASLAAIHAPAAQGRAAGVEDNSSILLSENLFIGPDGDRFELEQVRVALAALLKSGYVSILDPAEIRRMATNRDVTKEKMAIVLTKEDVENGDIWREGERETALRASVLVLGDRLSGRNYLYLEAVIGLARAVMAKDEAVVSISYRLISGVAIDDAILKMLKDDSQNNLGFALRAILRLKPVSVIGQAEFEKARLAMENALIAA